MKYLHCLLIYLWSFQLLGRESIEDQERNIKKVLSLNEPTIILTNELSGNTFDPLDASLTKNIRTMRLLYETPIRFDKNGFMISNVLSKFSFSPEKNNITFVLRNDLNYSDHTPVTILDLSITIKRMLLSRPDHPALNQIVGLTEWLKHDHPLEHMPSGFSIVNNTLSIRYTENIPQLLNWFTNEIFSIIPERCIDKKNSNLVCKIPPFSGEYELTQNEIPFVSFKKRTRKKQKPDKIKFIHISPVRIIKFLDFYCGNHVITTDDIYIPPDHRNILKNRFKQNSVPESRFMGIILNTNVPPFNNIRVRQFFAKEYRKTLEQLFGCSDGSIFTRMMPGYVPLDVLGTRIHDFTIEEENEIIGILRNHPPLWLARAIDGDHDPFQFYLSHTLKRLGIKQKPPIERIKGIKEYLDSWEKGKHNISRAYSGLGGPDPTNDLKMLFAKNMYYFMDDLYKDEVLQDLINNVSHKSVEEIDQLHLKKINAHLFEQAIFSTVINYTTVQYTLRSSTLKIVSDYSTDASHYFIN
ncbi:MAG: ABC transporter substrate-binding protein [Oligoflexales bacterium]